MKKITFLLAEDKFKEVQECIKDFSEYQNLTDFMRTATDSHLLFLGRIESVQISNPYLRDQLVTIEQLQEDTKKLHISARRVIEELKSEQETSEQKIQKMGPL